MAPVCSGYVGAFLHLSWLLSDHALAGLPVWDGT